MISHKDMHDSVQEFNHWVEFRGFNGADPALFIVNIPFKASRMELSIVLLLSFFFCSCLLQASVREARKAYDKEAKKPAELAKREAELQSRGYETWLKAKNAVSGAGDWSIFSSTLDEIVQTALEVARTVKPQDDPYDTMLDVFDPGNNRQKTSDMLTSIRDGLEPVIAALGTKPTQPENPLAGKQFPKEKQMELFKDIATRLGFDISRGRVDTSPHPFTGGHGPHDVRLTSRIAEDDLLSGLMATIHETGHAIYEQQKSSCEEMELLPAGEGLGMGMHESQSLFMERMIGQSRAFWKFATPIIADYFPEQMQGVTPEQMYKLVNIAQPSLIRVNADELTYPLHIILRWELEMQLLDGQISASKVPAIWNRRMKELLGVDVPNDANGCLQDIHWSAGAMGGYFPTYVKGSVVAAQLFEHAQEAIPDLEHQIAQGEFAQVRAWLEEKVHKVGSIYSSCDELLRQQFGETEGVRTAPLIQHLRQKYAELYHLKL